MTELAITLAILGGVFYAGYGLGRYHVVKEIKSMTKELERLANDNNSKHKGAF